MRRRYVTGVLADTSAWVEYLRGTGSPAHLELRRLIAGEAAVVTTEVVVMELLAGASDDEELTRLSRLLGRFELLPVEGLADYEGAAELDRRSGWRASAPCPDGLPTRPK